jgi:protein-S-isoprenylcysteine O-methyltransferase Ste14
LTVRAALGSLVFLVLIPGTMGGLIPWWITEWQAQPVPLAAQIAGFGLLAAGLAVLLEAFVRFAFEGRGTPAPIAPTEQLVVGGVYRHVRNPMYVAVTASSSVRRCFSGAASSGGTRSASGH